MYPCHDCGAAVPRCASFAHRYSMNTTLFIWHLVMNLLGSKQQLSWGVSERTHSKVLEAFGVCSGTRDHGGVQEQQQTEVSYIPWFFSTCQWRSSRKGIFYEVYLYVLAVFINHSVRHYPLQFLGKMPWSRRCWWTKMPYFSPKSYIQ